MKCKYEGSGVWEGRCVRTREVDPCEGYEKCKSYRPDCQTNADRIRGMSDEELAKFLESSHGCPTDDDCEYGRYAKIENCIKHWENWLRQPAEEEQHG